MEQEQGRRGQKHGQKHGQRRAQKHGQQGSPNSGKTGGGRWLMPVAIGVFVVVLGISYYLATSPPSPPGPDAGNSSGQAASTAPAPVPAPVSDPVSDPAPVAAPAPDNGPAADSVAALLADTEAAWGEVFRATGAAYDPPTPVIFSGAVASACGNSLAMGAFYCPTDGRLYLDRDFLRAVRERGGQGTGEGPGEMGEAYAVAHAVGHHVQNLLGNYDLAQQLLKTATDEEAGTIAVMFEMQADCYAGVWLKRADPARYSFTQGDIEKGLAAATAASDNLMRTSSGRRMPDPFNYGTAEERLQWFRKGLASGKPESCDTF